MKRAICVLVVVLGLVCAAQASSSWLLYDEFNSDPLNSSRWWVPDGHVIPVVSGGVLKFESEYVDGGEDFSSYAVADQEGVRGIRATLRVDSSSDSEKGGVELVAVNAASGYSYQCQFKLECWGDSLNLSAAVQENPDNVSQIKTVSANFSTDYDLSIVVGDDNYARFYLNGELFATSSQLTKSITDFGVGSWNVEPGTVKAFADNVYVASGGSSESPDLVIQSTSPTSETVDAGESVSVTVKTKNVGEGDAEPMDPNYFETALFMSDEDDFESMSQGQLDAAELDATEYEFGSLGAGSSVSKTYAFTAPSTPGTYYIRAKADEFDSVDEADESNNFGALVTLVVEGDVSASGSYEVWAGNTSPDEYTQDQLYSISKHGYVSLGTATRSARFMGPYRYYFVAARENERVKVDGVLSSGGGALRCHWDGNIEGVFNMHSVDGLYTTIGIDIENGTLGSFVAYEDSTGGGWIDVVTDLASGPAVPINFRAVYNQGYIDLSWSDVADATGYEIARKTGSGGKYSSIFNLGANIIKITDSTSFVVGETYYYLIRSRGSEVDSDWSSEVRVTFLPPGSLRVDIAPANASSAGAQWSLDGGLIWHDGGYTRTELSTGKYVVTFKSVDGWSAPSDRSVTVRSGDTVVLDSSVYSRDRGALRVNATDGLGAQWSIDDGNIWRTEGETLEDVGTGAYSVMFKDIEGWVTPENIPVVVFKGQTEVVTGEYIQLPVLKCSHSSLTQISIEGNDASDLSFDIWNAGGGEMSYMIHPMDSWVWTDEKSGTSSGERKSFDVHFNTAHMPPGVTNATFAVTAWDITGATGAAIGSPLSIPVTITVNESEFHLGNYVEPYDISVTPANFNPLSLAVEEFEVRFKVHYHVKYFLSKTRNITLAVNVGEHESPKADYWHPSPQIETYSYHRDGVLFGETYDEYFPEDGYFSFTIPAAELWLLNDGLWGDVEWMLRISLSDNGDVETYEKISAVSEADPGEPHRMVEMMDEEGKTLIELLTYIFSEPASAPVVLGDEVVLASPSTEGVAITALSLDEISPLPAGKALQAFSVMPSDEVFDPPTRAIINFREWFGNPKRRGRLFRHGTNGWAAVNTDYRGEDPSDPTDDTWVAVLENGGIFAFCLTPKNDADLDTLPDDWELENFENLSVASLRTDFDSDGLRDGQEQRIGSSPLLVDTDRDGFSDRDEVICGSSPTDPSSMPSEKSGLPPFGAIITTNRYDLSGLCKIWDVSGTYDEDVLGISFPMAQDGKGKIIGGGSWSELVEGVSVDATFAIKAKMKAGKDGSISLQLQLKHVGTADGEKFSANQKIVARIDAEELAINGEIQTSIKLGKQKIQQVDTFNQSLPFGMTGDASLIIESWNDSKGKMSGLGILELSNLEMLFFDVTGKPNSKTGAVTLGLKGRKSTGDSGAKIQMEVSGDYQDIESMKGKVMGQTILAD